jgi:hypothetical protein
MKLLDTMKRAADDEQLKLKPLPKHIIATQPELLRQNYALLLAALLSAQPCISETQARLTCLLLDALELGDIRGALFEQARELDEETPVKAARLIRDAGMAQHLLVDALVLLRLDTPLDDEIAGLIGEFASFLDVDIENLKTCSKGAAAILGLDNSRSVVATKRWPGAFPFIGKPIAPNPPKKQRSAAAKPKAAAKPSAKKSPAKKIW